MMKQILVLTFCVAVSQGFLFGGSGGGGGGCCCEPQCGPPQACCAPPPPPPQPCACAAPAPCAPQPQYIQPQYAPQPICRPRYIIIRPVEYPVATGGYQPVQQPIGPVPTGGEGYVSQPVMSQPQSQPLPQPQPQQQQTYVQPAATGPIETPQQAGYKALASKTQKAASKCNSAELEGIMEAEITAGNPDESKRRIHKAANEQFETANSERGIDVICSGSAFSYRIATDLFCEHTKADVTCFAYQQTQ